MQDAAGSDAVPLLPVEPPADPADQVTCGTATVPSLPPGSSSISAGLAVCTGKLCWENYPQGTAISAIGSGGGLTYAGGQHNAILSTNGTGWHPMCPPADSVSASWTGIAVNGPDDVWVISGFNPGGEFPARNLIYRWDGARWLRPAVLSTSTVGVSGGDGSDIYVTWGEGDPAAPSPVVARWNGSSLAKEPLPLGTTAVSSISARGGEAWLTTSRPTVQVLRRGVAGWAPVSLPLEIGDATVAADPAGGAFVATRDHNASDAVLLRCREASCDVVQRVPGGLIMALWGATAGRVLFDIANGTGSGITLLDTASGAVTAYPAPGDGTGWLGLTVAPNGTVYGMAWSGIDRLTGCGWTSELAFPIQRTVAVGGGAGNDLLAAFDYPNRWNTTPTIARFDGDAWTVLGSTRFAESIAGPSASDQWMPGILGEFEHWDGSELIGGTLSSGTKLFPAGDGSITMAAPAGNGTWSVWRRAGGTWLGPTTFPVASGKEPTSLWMSPDGQDLWAAAQWNPLCTNTGASVFHLHRGELHEIELPGTSVSAVVGGSDGSIWAYGGDYLCAGPHSPSFWIRTPLLRVAPEGVIATGQHDIVSLAPMPTGGVLASKYSWNQPATGTWLHTTGEPIDAWTRISPLGADLSLLRDGTVWSRGNLGWGRILRYIPQGR